MHDGYAYQDDVYTIRVSTLPPFPVYCDMSAEGWTVIQRRVDGGVNFFRNWHDYKEGFGEAGWNTEYWIGLERLYHLTNQRSYSLRITMRIGNMEFRYANYERFWIDGESEQYRLHVRGFSGTAGDALEFTGLDGARLHQGAPFSTFDRDNDNWEGGNCAQKFNAGWWFNDCYWANLNGPYVTRLTGWPPCTEGKCIAWRTISNYEDYSLKFVEMEVLPNPRF